MAYSANRDVDARPASDTDGVSVVARRGLRLAAACGVAALVVEALHGAEDVRADVGPAAALVVLLLVQGVAITAGLNSRRWAVRLLLALAAGWVLGALIDHPQVLSDPAGFRDGWSSSLAVLALIALNTASAIFAIAPAMPARWETLKTPPAQALAAIDRGDVCVLDVRTGRERSSGMIPGATVASWRRPVVADREGVVLVVCSHGARALQAVRTLRAQGIDARSISGGMSAYRRDGLPIERPS